MPLRTALQWIQYSIRGDKAVVRRGRFPDKEPVQSGNQILNKLVEIKQKIEFFVKLLLKQNLKTVDSPKSQ